MLEPCGNTAAEISRDQPVVLSREDWELRQDERERQLNQRKEFISTLLRNETYYQVVIIDGYGNKHNQPWFLQEAIENISDENFWSFLYCPLSDTIADIFADDPEKVSKLFIDGFLGKFKSLIQREVEKLADMLDGKL